jgi:hypothetical protein
MNRGYPAAMRAIAGAAALMLARLDGPVPAQLAFAAAGVGGIGWAVYRWRTSYIVVSAEGIETRCGRRHSFRSWPTIAALEVFWLGGRSPGFIVRAVRAPGVASSTVSIPLLPRYAGQVLRDAAGRAGVAVNPELPWCDRFGRWHVDPEAREPREAIRSVHEAFVGPWRIRVRRDGAVYWAVIEQFRGGAVLREGPPRASLREATDDGSRFVDDALATLDDPDVGGRAETPGT